MWYSSFHHFHNSTQCERNGRMPFLGLDHARTDQHVSHIFIYARVRKMLVGLVKLFQDYGICVTATQDYIAFLRQVDRADKTVSNLAVVVVHESIPLDSLKKKLGGISTLYLASENWLRLNSVTHYEVVKRGYYFVMWESSDKTARENWIHEMVMHIDFEPKPKKRKQRKVSSSLASVRAKVGNKSLYKAPKRRWGRAKQ